MAKRKKTRKKAPPLTLPIPRAKALNREITMASKAVSTLMLKLFHNLMEKSILFHMILMLSQFKLWGRVKGPPAAYSASLLKLLVRNW